MAVNAMCVCEYCDSYVPIYIVFIRWQKDTREIILEHITSFRVCPPCLTMFAQGHAEVCSAFLIAHFFIVFTHLSRSIMCLLFYNYLEIIILS